MALTESSRAGPALVPGSRRQVLRRLVLLDVLSVPVAFGLALLVRGWIAGSPFTVDLVVVLLFPPVCVAGLVAAGCYRPAATGLGSEAFQRFARGIGLGAVLLGFTSYVLNLDLSRIFTVLLLGFLAALGLLARLVLRRTSSRAGSRLSTRVVVAGDDATSRRVADALESRRAAGYEVLGFLARDATSAAGDVVGSLRDVEAVLDELHPDAVVASPSALTTDELNALFLLLQQHRAELIVYPTLVEVAGRRLDIETVGMLPLLHLSNVHMTLPRRALKRGLDLGVAVVAGLVAIPVLLVAAAMIRRDSAGPVLFRQERIGRDGRPFTLLKLRTMVVGAEEQLDQLLASNEAGDGLFKMRQDPRLTRSGATLRRLSIDELPQLWNVLRGQMSVVGPRPALAHEVDAQAEAAWRRHRLKPGITGYWQVSGRSDVTADEAIRMDLYYVENWSLAFDLLILAETVRVVLAREGAY